MHNIYHNNDEQYYKRLLLKDKLKPFLTVQYKYIIFNLGYCWDILFNDKHISSIFIKYITTTKIEKNSETAKKLEDYIYNKPKMAISYVVHFDIGRFFKAEPYIVQESIDIHRYSNVLYYFDQKLFLDFYVEYMPLSCKLLETDKFQEIIIPHLKKLNLS